MVNSGGEEDVCKSVSNKEYLTLNPIQLEELTTSGLSEERRSLKENIRKRLTARVIPITRDRKSQIENTLERIKKLPSSEGVFTTQSSEADCTIVERRESVIKTEKADIPTSKASRELEKVNLRKHKIYRDAFLEPQPKQTRTSSPICLPQQNHTLSMKRTPPVTSEPRLLGENVATMSLLTASQGHLATLQDEDGDTPLHIAIAQGQVPLVQYLIHIASTSGISLDIYNRMKQTPLHLAVITNQPLVIRFLIAAGVDISMPDRNGQTAIHLACQRSSVECLMELVNARQAINLELKNFSGFTPLHEAVMSNSPEVIKFLVAYGTNVDCKDGKSGRTPLHYAVEFELLPVIQLLMNSGANVNATSFSGNTPIQTASGRGLHHVTKLLLGNLQEASARGRGHSSSKYKLKSTTTWKQ